jgi:Domain of unknown function (DUF4382)
MLGTSGLAGCGNSCFAGYSNNGNSSAIIIGSNPPPVCSLTQANGTMRAVALKSPVCETCTAAARVEHVIVTVRSIGLRPSAGVSTSAPDWLEIAPQLANEPRQFDLIGSSMPEILVESAVVPAGSYREVRMLFTSGFPTSAQELPSENACGEIRWNCIVMADGRVEPLRLPGEMSGLFVTFQGNESDSLIVLPDAKLDLRLSLEPRHEFYPSSTEGSELQTVLTGHATAVPRFE